MREGSVDIRVNAPTAVEGGIPTAIAGGRDLALVMKRTFDLIGATALLAVLLPAVLVVALLVYASSPGPIFFRQRRVGRDGRLFSFYKFRTMYYGTDESAHRAYYQQLVDGTARPKGRSYKLEDDPRVTPLGRMLRRFSLDEIPQLLNVLVGDMSLVGPRPPIPYEVEMYGAREYQRLSVMPGLTGLWQVSGRSTLSFQEMIELDLVYISRWSLTFDLLILLRTPWAVISGVGAC
jgi:lipopolysaccharide/colanic/teichoic acid biosynthesis glycosyltransferase